MVVYTCVCQQRGPRVPIEKKSKYREVLKSNVPGAIRPLAFRTRKECGAEQGVAVQIALAQSHIEYMKQVTL